MNIYQKLLDCLQTQPIPVQSVIIGVHWTMVCSKHCGIASTMVNEGPHGHLRMRDVGTIHNNNAQELAQWIYSDNLLEASVGMAAINSLLEIEEEKLIDINAAEVIAREGKNKNVSIIGHFPFVDRIKDLTRNCWVIEKHPFGGDFPEELASQYLPKADVIAITGTAFINHTIEGLLSLCPPGALIMILGPSTPLAPFLFEYGVKYLSGARIDDPETACGCIMQGACLPQVKGIRLVTLSHSR